MSEIEDDDFDSDDGDDDAFEGWLPIRCLVTDLRATCGSFDRLIMVVHEAVRGGCNMVIIRNQDADDREFARFNKLISHATTDRALVVTNMGTRPLDLVRIPDTFGYHFPEAQKHRIAEVKSKEEHKHVEVGCSVHSTQSAKEAEDLGADYVLLGTIFSTVTHPGGLPQGLDLIRETASAINIPIIAIGGIDLNNAASVIHAGAGGVAVIRAISSKVHPRDAAIYLRDEVMNAWEEKHA